MTAPPPLALSKTRFWVFRRGQNGKKPGPPRRKCFCRNATYVRRPQRRERGNRTVIAPDSSDTDSTGTDQVKTVYDRLGGEVSVTDQRGVVHTYTYDAAGRLCGLLDLMPDLGGGLQLQRPQVGLYADRELARESVRHPPRVPARAASAKLKCSSVDYLAAGIHDLQPRGLQACGALQDGPRVVGLAGAPLQKVVERNLSH